MKRVLRRWGVERFDDTEVGGLPGSYLATGSSASLQLAHLWHIYFAACPTVCTCHIPALHMVQLTPFS